MTRSATVHFLPTMVTRRALQDATVVVIDVLRATTTVCAALAEGAAAVVPCRRVEDALVVEPVANSPSVLRGGERNGVAIDGFDLGNSPDEYPAEVVSGRTIAFTTTNGTRAVARCRLARRVLLGSFVNLRAVVQSLMPFPRVHLLCAGTRGAVSREDLWLAGSIVDALKRQPGDSDRPHAADAHAARFTMNDEAAIAQGEARSRPWAGLLDPSAGRQQHVRRLIEDLSTTRGGRNLVKLGLEKDIEFAAQCDSRPVVPRLDMRRWCFQVP